MFFHHTGVEQTLDVQVDGVDPKSISTSALSVIALATDTLIPTVRNYAAQGGAASFTWNTAEQYLPDGYYESRYATEHIDLELRFGFLNADFNGDNAVGFNDLVTVAQNYDQTGKAWVEGDANYDTVVNFADLVIVAQGYGKRLADVPTSPGSVVAGNATSTTIDIAWASDPTQDVDGFKISRSDDAGVTYQLIETLADPAARTFTNSGLSEGRKYWYRVRAYKEGVGVSPSSMRAQAVTKLAAPRLIEASRENGTTVVLNFRDFSNNEDGFRVDFVPVGGGKAKRFNLHPAGFTNPVSYSPWSQNPLPGRSRDIILMMLEKTFTFRSSERMFA